MKEITTADVRKRMAELLGRAAYGKERFVITRHGKQLAAIVPLEELNLLDKLRALVAEKDFADALSELEREGGVPWDELRRTLGL